MNEAQQKKAVLYCRVSSAQQTTRTDGLSSQEQRCRLFCEHRGCTDYAKSIPRAKIEDAFEAMLKSLTPARQLVELATEAFRNLWNRQILKAGEAKKSITEEIRSIERKVAQLLDRIVEAKARRSCRLMKRGSRNLKGGSSFCGSSWLDVTSLSRNSTNRFEQPCNFSQVLGIFGKVISSLRSG
jgi:hypothetical protein